MVCPFLDKAPLEIRDEIYRYLLSIKYTKRPVHKDEIPSRAKRGLGSSYLFDFQPAILSTNKKINTEARHFPYRDNLFVLVNCPKEDFITTLRKEGLTLLAAKEDEVRSFLSSLRISLQVDMYIQGIDDLRAGWQFVIAADELSVVCRLLTRLDNAMHVFLANLTLVLTIFPSYQVNINSSEDGGTLNRVIPCPRSLLQQHTLLNPFAMLHSIKDFKVKVAKVDGQTDYIDAQLIKYIKRRISQPPASMEEILAAAAVIKDQGNEAFHAGKFWLAHSLYESGLERLDAGVQCWIAGARRRKSSEPIKPMLISLQQVLVPMLSNSAVTLLRLQQWVAAHKEVTDVIKSVEDFREKAGDRFDHGKLAKLYYQRALASEGMGKMAQAVEEVEEALEYDPNNAMMNAKKLKLKARGAKRIQAALEAMTV